MAILMLRNIYKMPSFALFRSIWSLRFLQRTAQRSLRVHAHLRQASSRSAAGSAEGNTLLLVGLGATAVGSYVVYRQLRQPPPTLHSLKKEGYKESQTVHPEQEAESEASQSGPPPTTTEAPLTLPSHVQYLLIGAGTASHACASAIRQRDPAAKILIIGDEAYPPYMRPPLSKALWQEEDREQARALRFRASWTKGTFIDVFYQSSFVDVSELEGSEEGGTAVLANRRVVHLSPGNKEVALDNGAKIKFDKCLIATGGVPKTLPLFQGAGAEVQKHVSVYRQIPDFLTLDKLASTKQSVLVVGGGFLGSELAVALASRGKARERVVTQLFPEGGNMGKVRELVVTQLFPEGGNLGLVLPPALSEWTTQQARNEGVEVLPNTTLEKVEYKNGKVYATTNSGQELKVDHVVLAVGLQPNTALARGAGLEVDPQHGGFRVNSELQACTDVWVAGDVACFYDPHLGRRRVEHHDHANVSGRLAGENMTGAGKPFTHQSMFWSDVGPKVGFEAVGIVDSALPTVGVWAKTVGEGEGKSEEVKDDFSKGVVFYTKGGVVVGVLTWNIFGKMDLARKVIADRQTENDISSIIKDFNIH